MTIIRIRLLGQFQLTYDNQALDLERRPRVQSLLAYLLLHREQPRTRQQLITALWPDAAETQGRNRLRNLLFQTRQLLPDAARFIHADAAAIRWRTDAPCEVDVATFTALLAQAASQPAAEPRTRLLAAAVEQYAGDLFPACYDDWIVPLREELRARYGQALEALIAAAEARGQPDVAQHYAEQLLRHDPLRDTTYQRLMRLLAQQGQQAKLAALYEAYVARLAAELDAAPSAGMQQLYMRLTAQAEPASAGATEPGETSADLVGRTREWKSLLESWQSVQEGASRLVVIQGAGGVGKTRLAQELLQWAEQRQILTATATCYAAEGALPYGPVADWLRADGIWATLGSLENVWLAEVARLLPEVQERVRDHSILTAADETWSRQHFFAALAVALLEHGQPVLLHLDNLQWADQETHEWLHYLVRYSTPTPLLIVATLRTDDAAERSRCQPLLRGLRSHDLLHELTLMPLSLEETRTLAERTAGRSLPPGQLDTLFAETEGNPLFVIETLRANSQAVSAAAPATAPAMGAHDDIRHLPPKIRALIESRLARLAPSTLELMQVAAVAGRRVSYQLLLRIGDQDEETVMENLEELWQQNIVAEASPAYFDFSHEKVREVAYAGLSPMRRRFLHRKVAEGLAELHADALSPVSGQLALHFEAAGEFGRAVEHYAQAGSRAARLHAHKQADQAYANAIRLGRQLNLSLATLSNLYIERGRVLELSGDYVDATATYHELEALAKVHGDQSLELTAVVRLITCYIEPSSVHDRRRARALIERGLALARIIGDLPIEVQLLRTRLVDESHYGTDAAAHHVGEEAVAVARAAELTNELGYVLNDFAAQLRLSGRQPLAQSYATEARVLFRAQDNLPMLADNLAQQAWHELHQAELGQAMETAAECIALSERINNGWNLCLALHTQGQILTLQGQWGEAIERFERAMLHGEQAGFAIGTVVTPCLLGELLRIAGDRTRAQGLHATAREEAVRRAPFLLYAPEAQCAINAYQCGESGAGEQWFAASQRSRPAGAIGRGWCVLAHVARAAVVRAEQTGQWRAALDEVRTSLAEAEARQLPIYLPQLWLEESRCRLALGKLEAARQSLARGQAQASAAGLLTVSWQGHLLAAQCAQQVGDVETAEAEWALARIDAANLAASLHDPALRTRFTAHLTTP